MDKIKAQDILDETKCIQDYYKRATHIADCGQKSKSFFEKESERKKKYNEDRFSKANSNLRTTNRDRQIKNKETEAKFVPML